MLKGKADTEMLMKALFFPLWMVALFAVLPAISAANDAIRLQYCYQDRELLPYYTGQSAIIPKEKPGATIELIYLLAEKLPDVDFQLIRRPWKRCLHELENGTVDAVVGSYKPDRERIGQYPMFNGELDIFRAIDTNAYCYFSIKSAELQWNGQKFTGQQRHGVAIPLGYSIEDLLIRSNIKTLQVESNSKGFHLLSHARVDGMATLCGAGRRIMDKAPDSYRHVIVSKAPLKRNVGFFIVSRQFYRAHPAVAEVIWDELVNLRDDYNRFLSNY